HGDIMFIHAGMTPIRPDGDLNWSAPVDGNTPKTVWLGIHPIDDHLIIKSPSAGFLQNNNVDPRLMDSTPPKEVAGKPEYMLSEGFLPKTKSTTRALRAIEVLSAANGMTEEAALRLAFDAKTDLSEKWLSLLEAALPDAPASADAEDVFLNDLLAFDGEMSADSTGALKYVYWREAFRELLTASDVEALAAAFSSGAALQPETNAKLTAAVTNAEKKMEKMPGGFARRYGDEFRQAGEGGKSWPRSGGSLEAYPGVPSECGVETILCDTTLFPASYSPPDANGVRYAISGSRLMRIDFYSPKGIRSYTAHNPGISDDPTSPHADDQAERLLSRGEMKEIYFDWESLAPHIVSTTSLQVKND
ncbi:MAG: penicillin acylase family protein, partial [Amphiplicatus sp.]|nr:penicillin acylase family protein [Amphiplicatus sp.]